MSNLQALENVKQVVMMAEPDFTQLAKIHNAVNFKIEASFALQLLKDNDYLARVAMGDQDSFKRAIINIAAIGLSLSPVHKHAYLVPRGKRVCLDISYRGLVQLAVDVGAIKYAVAELVHEKDTFQFKGHGEAVVHQFNPFADRGEIVGAYCSAKMHDGEYLTTMMPISEIHAIRNRSESWKSGQKGPWATDEGEMIKKTVIKRASKSWPMTDTRRRFEQAIDVTNEVDPIDFNAPQLTEGKEQDRKEALTLMLDLLKQSGRTEEKLLSHLTRSCKRTIKSFDDLTTLEIDQAMVFLNSIIEKEKAAENENA